jgi:hypothetical protein
MTKQEQELRDLYRRLKGLQVDVTRLFRRLPWEASPGNAMGLGVGDPQLTATWTTQTTPEAACKRLFLSCEGLESYRIAWASAIFSSGTHSPILMTSSSVSSEPPSDAYGYPTQPCFSAVTTSINLTATYVSVQAGESGYPCFNLDDVIQILRGPVFDQTTFTIRYQRPLHSDPFNGVRPIVVKLLEGASGPVYSGWGEDPDGANFDKPLAVNETRILKQSPLSPFGTGVDLTLTRIS